MKVRWDALGDWLVSVRERTPEQGRRGRLLALVLLISLLLDLLLTLANLWSWSRSGTAYDRGYYLFGLVGLAFLIWLWAVNRRGHTQLAAVLLVLAYFVRIAVIQEPTRFANVFWAFAFPIIISSFVLKPSFSYPAAGLAIALYLATATRLGFQEPPEITLFRIIGLFALATFPFLSASHLNRAIERIDRSEAKYRDLFNDLPIGLYRTSPDGRILDANAAFREMFGLQDREELEGIRAADLYAEPASRGDYLAIVEEARTTEFQMRRPDGGLLWVSDHVAPVRGPDGRVVCYEGSLVDITERRQAVEKLENLATRDPLTGIANRRHFFQEAERIFERSCHPPYELSLLMIDLDHFKRVNDFHGHAAGDLVLKVIADRLQAGLRSCDLLGRYGGEEFAVLLARIGREDTHRLAERLRCSAAGPVPFGGEELRVTLSVGVARLDADTRSLDQLVRRADRALYLAKSSGRNRWVEWTPDLMGPG